MKIFFSMLGPRGDERCSANANGDVFALSGGMDVFQATTNASNTGSGLGNISGSYDDVTNQLDYTLTWQDLTSTVSNIHFHLGAPGTAGGVQLAVAGPWTSPQTGSATLDATQESNLLGGLWYANVHTANFAGGEIRGQVLVSAVPEPGSVAFCAFAAVGICLRRRKSTK